MSQHIVDNLYNIADNMRACNNHDADVKKAKQKQENINHYMNKINSVNKLEILEKKAEKAEFELIIEDYKTKGPLTCKELEKFVKDVNSSVNLLVPLVYRDRINEHYKKECEISLSWDKL
jgi:RNA-splicing ligase RtcB